MKEADFLTKTSTFGPTLEDREYTEDEKLVLKHFFTNIDKNIYAATDAMPNTLWALLEGGYSRSQLSMRMRFLDIFREMEKDLEKGKIAQEDVITIKQFADNIRSGSTLDLSFFLSKAEKFMRKWAVQYGHSSLKDSDVVRFAIENITQYATKRHVEEARLGAYQEKSTRYVPFSKDHLVIPTDLKQYACEIKEWNDFLYDCYESCMPAAAEFLKKKLDRSTFKTDAAFDRTVNAKVFDIVRYFLPSTLLTSIGVVWPTREAERHISKLMSDPREEVRMIGQTLLEEGKKVSPGLLSHVNVNEYHRTRSNDLLTMSNSAPLPQVEPLSGRMHDAVTLLEITPEIETKMAAGMLYEHHLCNQPYSKFLSVCRSNPALVSKTFSTYLNNRGQFDEPHIAAEVGSILFEVTMDLGGYRDLQRHRRNLILPQPFSAVIGFEYPQYVEDEPELAEIKHKMDLCAHKTQELHEKIRRTHPMHAEYVVMFSNKIRFLWQMDPRQLSYVVELRSTPAGHHSYRRIVQEMFKEVAPYMPNFARFIRVDMSGGDEGRKKQEERTVEKLQQLGGDLMRKS
ncbi:MAG: FAD-dependent thymidylate synthase [Candidatus Nanoarchaeia archaeon]